MRAGARHVPQVDAAVRVLLLLLRRFRRRLRVRDAGRIVAVAADAVVMGTLSAVIAVAADAVEHAVTVRSAQICVRQSAAAAARARDARGAQQRPRRR